MYKYFALITLMLWLIVIAITENIWRGKRAILVIFRYSLLRLRLALDKSACILKFLSQWIPNLSMYKSAADMAK